ncbi:MAG: PhoH family protein [Blautia sp.]
MTQRGKPIRCKTIGQRNYVKALRDNVVTLCIGPAGTGKTYLAVAQAVQELKAGKIERIIMSRPAIEAGEERLGFLPGDLSQKVDPYLRPLYDALYDMYGAEKSEKLRERGTIEIAPLAYMRGRTLNHARVIIDESQNASLSTLKMALTRLGEGSKMVLTGDVTQIDLPKTADSGLERCAQILSSIEGIGIVRLNNRDVVRNKIVKDIVKAFEKAEGEGETDGAAPRLPRRKR